jgi:hypothetical protein
MKKALTVREFSDPKRVLDIVERVTKLAELITESPLTPGALGWRACRLQTGSLSKNRKREKSGLLRQEGNAVDWMKSLTSAQGKWG